MPKPRLTFLHTAPANAKSFGELAEQLASDIDIKHVLAPEYLEEAISAGGVSLELQQRIASRLVAEADAGANIVLLSCSTIGSAADLARTLTSVPIMRIDRPMAETAVRLGPRILVAACVESTIYPTFELIESTAGTSGSEVQIKTVLLSGWEKWQAGDARGYAEDIAAGLRSLPKEFDVVVLAQASMANAASLLEDLGVPVLSSPRLGLEAALSVLRRSL